MKKYILILFFAPLVFHANGQQLFQRPAHDPVWVFGDYDYSQKLDFNTTPPTFSLIDYTIEFAAANSSICNANGALRLFSNGFRVLNDQNQYLENGFRINEQYNFTEEYVSQGHRHVQGVLALPVPEDTSNYLLFYTEELYFTLPNGVNTVASNKLYLAEASFQENNQGEIIDKDFLLINDTLNYGQMTACRHGNGRDWWFLVPNLDSRLYNRLLITPDGVENHGTTVVDEDFLRGPGQVAFSPDGKRYVVYNGDFEPSNNHLTFYDFDRCTGVLSNPVVHTHDLEGIINGIAISDNSRFVYHTAVNNLYQYDLQAADIPASRTLIDTWDGYYNWTDPDFFAATFGLAQLAPNGKIYIATPGSGLQYHIIHNPNKRGTASNFEQRGLPFTQWNFRSIPNLPYYGLGPWDGSPCDTLNINNPLPEARYEHTQDSSVLQFEFFDASHYAYKWSWDFGDGSATDTMQLPVHTFPASGTYQVCLQVSNVTGEDVYCEEIYVGVVSTNNPISENFSVQVYPNPVGTGPLTVELEGPGLSSLGSQPILWLRNAQGHTVGQTPFRAVGRAWQATLEVQHLPAGIYFYEAIGSDGVKLGQGKMVKG